MFFRAKILSVVSALALFHPAVRQSRAESNAVDLERHQEDHRGDDGKYDFGYRTSNQIFVHESGYMKNPDTHVKDGCYSYFSPEGYFISTVYTADENGFRPKVIITNPIDPVRHQQHLDNPCDPSLLVVPGLTPSPQPPIVKGYCPCQRDDFHPFVFTLRDNSLVRVKYSIDRNSEKLIAEIQNGTRTYNSQISYLSLDDSFPTTRRTQYFGDLTTRVYDDRDIFKPRIV